jgi:hypothetical protein
MPTRGQQCRLFVTTWVKLWLRNAYCCQDCLLVLSGVDLARRTAYQILCLKPGTRLSNLEITSTNYG